MPNINRSLLLTYSKVNGSSFDVSAETLSVLDKHTWAKVLARLNHLAHNRKDYPPAKVLSDWFSQDNNKYANDLYEQIDASYNALNVDPTSLVTVNIWSNLTMLDRILSSPEVSQDRVENLTSERLLFDIYLAINEEFGNKTDKIFDSVDKTRYPDIVDLLSRVCLTNLFPYHDLNHLKAIELLISQSVKSFYCFKFLETYHSELLSLFLRPYGIHSWKEYLKVILSIASSTFLKSDDSGLNYIDLTDSPDKQKSKIFFDHLALVDEAEYKVKTDFLHARAQPLFKVGDYRYLILDEILVVNRIYNSMFFELLRIAEKNTHLNPAYKDFFSLYTYDFIEKYLCYSLLDRIFKKGQNYRLSGAEILKKFGITSEPDYYVRSGNKVFLFEIKGSIVMGETKQSFSYEKIENELKEKFLFNSKDNENKAIIQLVERISLLFSNSASYDKKAKGHKLKIYPILLVSEIVLTTPGVNYIFNQWFWEEIGNRESLENTHNRIHDLIVLDIDSLVLFSKNLESNNGAFEELILKYYATIDKNKVKPKYGVKPEVGDVESKVMTAIQPFNGFMKDNIKGEAPDIFMEFGKALLENSEIE